ncbi:unnamed protein product [Parajaminaea phylloscopi]
MMATAGGAWLARATPPVAEPDGSGTGRSLPTSLLVIATVSSLSATILSLLTIYVHLKNYRKPHLQRFVVRLILIVPIYATSSCIGLFSLPAAFLIDLIRDLYEAFAIYCFFELLVAYLGGERSVLILMIGRRPVSHPWPFNILLREMDMSDPYTFLAIKRGILQYVQIKPILAISTVILKSFGRYEEGDLEAGNGYTYVSTVYNISIFLSLYCLAIFWKALSPELEPFRPTAKFLTVKGVVFATFWQGWAISVLVAAGLVKSIGPISDQSFLRLGLQDLLLTLEMPLFALGHMYAFSYRDYVDSWATHQARLPITYALRDALGGRDVLEDSLTTIRGTGYGYQTFEPSQGAVHQGLARTRRLHAGLRYTAGGKGKYFLPSRAIHASVPWAEEGTRIQGPLSAVKKWMEERRMRQGGFAPMTDEEEAEVVHDDPDSNFAREHDQQPDRREQAEAAARRLGQGLEAGLNFFNDPDRADDSDSESLGFHTPRSHGSEENLYTQAKRLEHGDYAFPTIACVPEEERKRRRREEEEWLLGGGHGRGQKSGSTASRDRRKHVEGWLDRMRGLVAGQDTEDSNKDAGGNSRVAGTSSAHENGGKTASARGKKRRSSSSSASKPKKTGSGGGESSRKVKAKKSRESKASDGQTPRGSDTSQNAKADGKTSCAPGDEVDADESLVSHGDDADEDAVEEEAGAVDLIIADTSAEHRQRAAERRRGDPALRIGREEKRVFKRMWSGGSGEVPTVQQLQKTRGLGHGGTSAVTEQGGEASAATTTHVKGPQGPDRAEGQVAIEVEAPGSKALAKEAEQHSTASQEQASQDKGLADAPRKASGSEARSDASAAESKEDAGTGPGSPGTASSVSRDDLEPHHMPVYQRHDWRWQAPDEDGQDNPWA